MTLSGGGWTAFFSGRLGEANVFAYFVAVDGVISDDCSAPDTLCLRHIPSTVTLASTLAATCGDAAVLMTVAAPGAILDYFRTGASYEWQGFATVAGKPPRAARQPATPRGSGPAPATETSDGSSRRAKVH